jgi:DNA-binding PadR family transcriptional regulator
MPENSINTFNQPLTPAVFHILLALADGEKHGYAIMKDVEAQTSGQIKMGPGTLYGSIKRMLSAGLIKETDERPAPELDDERRRYYRITAQGQSVVVAESKRLASAVKTAQEKGVLVYVCMEWSL